MSKPFSVLDVNTEPSWIGRMPVLGISLLLGLTVALGAFVYAVPKVANGKPGNTRRLSWYLRSGQWRADARTLAAAFQFLVDSDPVAPIPSKPTTTDPVSYGGFHPQLAH